MKVYDNKVYGVKVSEYGLENGYLDYEALRGIIGSCILNNTIMAATPYDWEQLTGEYDEIYQYYIISEYGYKFLREYTDEIVFYNEKLDIYIWGVTHFGTAWNYVLTNIELEMED